MASKKLPPVVRDRNGYYIIDRGPGVARPILGSREEAERLLAMEEKWHGKRVLFWLKGTARTGRVTNTALSYEDHNGMGPVEKVQIACNGSAYWEYAANVEEVNE